MTYIQPNPNGQATMADSAPTVIASDQTDIPVIGTVTANIGTVGTLATAAKQDTGNVSIASVDTKIGEVQASPTANTVLDRLKAIATALSGTLTVASHAVTNAGVFAVQATEADGANVTLGAKADAKSTATDTTAITAMSVWKQISASVQAIATSVAGTLTVATHAVTQSGTWNIGSITTLPAIPAGSNNIGDVDVLTLPSLPAGSNAIGKLAANSGVDIGDVDVLSLPALPAGSNNIGDVDVLTVIPGTGAANLGKIEDAAHTTADVGVMSLGVRAAAPTDRSAGPTDGDYEPFATNEVGAVWVSHTHSANGGATTMNATSSDGGTALTSTVQAIKASAGTLVGYYIYNPNATAQFVQFYNTASGSVTVGTTNPLFMCTIPATAGANLWMPGGIAFSTAIAWAATSTAGGNGAPATAMDAVAWYK